jgi:hypothetical protein
MINIKRIISFVIISLLILWLLHHHRSSQIVNRHFTPENALEEQLIRENSESGRCSGSLIKALSRTNVVVVGDLNTSQSAGSYIAHKGTKIFYNEQVIHGKHLVPIYTSLHRLAGILQHEEPYVQINGKTFVELTNQDAWIVINQGYEAACKFSHSDFIEANTASVDKH